MTKLSEIQKQELFSFIKDIKPYVSPSNISPAEILESESLQLTTQNGYTFFILNPDEDETYKDLVKSCAVFIFKIPYPYYVIPISLSGILVKKSDFPNVGTVALNSLDIDLSLLRENSRVSHSILTPATTLENFQPKIRTLHLPFPCKTYYLSSKGTTKEEYINSYLKQMESTCSAYRLYLNIFYSTIQKELQRAEKKSKYSYVIFSHQNFPTFPRNFFTLDENKNPVFHNLSTKYKLLEQIPHSYKFKLSLPDVLRDKIFPHSFLSPLHPELVKLTLKKFRSLNILRFLLLLLYPHNSEDMGGGTRICKVTLANLLQLLHLNHSNTYRLCRSLNSYIEFFRSISLLIRPELLDKNTADGWDDLRQLTSYHVKNQDFITFKFYINNPMNIVTPEQQKAVYTNFCGNSSTVT